jgi:uncharacterized membrane protein (DUF106 family)
MFERRKTEYIARLDELDDRQFLRAGVRSALLALPVKPLHGIWALILLTFYWLETLVRRQ